MNADLEKVLQEGIERLNNEAKTFNTKSMDLQSLQDEIEQIQAVATKIGNEVEYMNVERDARHSPLLELADEPPRDPPQASHDGRRGGSGCSPARCSGSPRG